ncbi:rhomboid family protein [Pararhodonellum marinum]|uniref:rhomboid family protein n=1 Tax=Pararhodonellum marinum TaxID=2755358 RepID=UPI00188E0BFB|nr:rhomboid family intramembrane serine protease [Pararhodonellum marinum]
MYGGFWYNLRNAFTQNNNSLYKILAINLLMFFVLLFFRVLLTIGGGVATYKALLSYLMMPAALDRFILQPWSIMTYMFLHEGIFHILFNMLFLYWFGLLIHEYLGSRKLANLYILGGLVGAILYVVMYNLAPYFRESVEGSFMLGASAGVYAIVVGAATMSPNTTFNLILLGPVKIKYIAIFYVVIAFANSTGANAGGELAHLGGAALGYFYVTQLRNGKDWGGIIQSIGRFFENLFKNKPKIKVTYRKNAPYKSEPLKSDPRTTSNTRSSGKSAGQTAVATQEEIDLILDKIADKGYDSLSKEEKRKLFEFSNK